MLRHIPRRFVVKWIAVVLAASQLALNASSARQVRTARPSAAPAPKVKVNRTVPKVTPPAESPTFSTVPTVAEIFRARVFAEPIVPVGTQPAPSETKALASALITFHRDGGRSWRPTLGRFLEDYPNSPWRPSLLLSIGGLELEAHAYSGAFTAWDEAWRSTSSLSDSQGRAVADAAVAEWLLLAASFGQVQNVEERLVSMVDRSFSGSAAVKIQRAREIASLTKRHPELAKYCGPEALIAFAKALESAPGGLKVLTAFRGTPEGLTLTELGTLAKKAGLSLHAARRTTATDLPVPSVVHWTIGHYSTLVERDGDRYRVFDGARNESYWLERSQLLRESSGYFLVPDIQEGWVAVTAVEGDLIRGSGPLCPDGSPPPGPAPPPPPCDCKGMARYALQQITTSLALYDSPIGYAPTRGPSVPFSLSYQQRDMLQPQIFSYANLGPKWSVNWTRFVKEEPTDALGYTPVNVWVLLPPGGREVYVNPDAQGVYPAHPDSKAVLVKVTSSPIRYERRLRDGTVEVFTQSDGAAAGSRRIFLTAIIDPQGLQLQFTWDSQFRLVALTDAAGLVTTFSYDLGTDPLKVTGITDPFGRTASFSYNAVGQLESITDVLGIQSRFNYGGDDFISTLTTPYGITTFRHEPSALNSGYNSRFVEATDPLGATERIEFQWETPSLPATESVVPTGFTSRNANLNRYNSFYWSARAYAAGGADLSHAVITHWLLQSEWDGWQLYSAVAHSIKRPLENRVWYAYPGQVSGAEDNAGTWNTPSMVGRVVDDGSSQIFQTTYNSNGLPLTVTDPLGRQTTMTYASNNIDLLTVHRTTGTIDDTLATFSNYVGHLPQSITGANGQTTTLAYNSNGQVATVTNALTQVTTYGYSSSGNLASIAGPISGSTITYVYDDYGRLRTETLPDGYVVTRDYDVFDRPTRTTYPDGTYEELGYSYLDVTSFRDRAGRLTRYFYDANQRRTGVRDPLGRTTGYQWCSCGSLDATVDANGRRSSWERDLLGRATRAIGTGGGTTDFLYENTTSRLKRRTDSKSQQTNYTYYLDDALAGITYTNATTSTPSVSYTYDAAYGRLATVTDGSDTTTYSYSPPGSAGAGLVASVDGPLTNDTVTYAYDATSRLSSRTLNGSTTTWTYDDLSRVTAIGDAVGTFEYAYDGVSGRVSQITYPNNQTSTYSYLGNTGDHRLQQIHHQTSTAATLSKFTLGYDVLGNVTSWTQQYESTMRTYDLGYDAGSQLTAATYRTTDATPTILVRLGYTYDLTGNRTSAQLDDAPTTWAYDSANRMTSQATGGQLVFQGTVSEPATVTIQGRPATVNSSSGFVGSATVVGGTNTISVTATDSSGNTRANLYEVQVDTSSGSVTHDANGNLIASGTKTYEWDAENRLVRVLNNGTEVASFTYDSEGRRVSKSAGGVTRHFIYDRDDVLEERTDSATVRYIDGMGIDDHLAAVEGNTPTYFLSDHLGSVVQTTNASQAITLTRRYDPYGKLLAGDSTAGYAFTGREWDPETGLYYYRARYYDPIIGRFISEDPIEPQSFEYAANRPTTLVDPSGLMTVNNRMHEHVVDQSKIRNRDPRKPDPVAMTEIQGTFSCICECVDGTYKLSGFLFLYGDMYLPQTVRRTPAADPTVKDTATARAHEYGWHIDPAVAAVRAIVEPQEKKPYASKADCDKACKNLMKKIPNEFRYRIQLSQDKENSMGKR